MLKSAEEFRRLRLSVDPDEYRRAAHESAPVRVWLEVIRRYPEMRAWVAHNKTVPTGILTILSNDPDPRVRFFVAMKRKLPEDLQLKLARDPDDGVRDRLVWNAKASPRALQILAEDREERIRERAKARLAGGSAP